MATQTVTAIIKGYSNSALRIPFSYASLDCGHSASAGADGGVAYTHEPSVKVGDAVECERCDWQAKNIAALREAVAAGIVSHTRADRRDFKTIHVYRREPTSPTGVLHLLSIEESPEVNAILRGSLSPLSPTEGR